MKIRPALRFAGAVGKLGYRLAKAGVKLGIRKAWRWTKRRNRRRRYRGYKRYPYRYRYNKYRRWKR